MLLPSKLLKVSIRLYSQVTSNLVIEPLTSKSLIKVKGNEVQDFLQGLITNDIYHLNKITGGSMYTMFLNPRGRVLYDAIVYKIPNDEAFLIECDSKIENSLEKHLKLYRVRRKIDICNVTTDYKLHVLFNPESIKVRYGESQPDNKIDSNNIFPQTSSLVKLYNDILIFRDPRVAELGFRLISKADIEIYTTINNLTDIIKPNSIVNYKTLCYSMGIGEGVDNIPVGHCFPLECNCDYLHGISFQKGCYIGQELTARTHHTGVVRKRLMPLYFEKIPSILPTDNILSVEKTKLGKFRGIESNFGLALLRIDLALDLSRFMVGNELALVWKPHWWPVVLPKEKTSLKIS